jgi:hypothetical protein
MGNARPSVEVAFAPLRADRRQSEIIDGMRRSIADHGSRYATDDQPTLRCNQKDNTQEQLDVQTTQRVRDRLLQRRRALD